MKLYLLLKQVDLGDHVVGVYDSNELAVEACRIASDIFVKKYKSEPDFSIEEIELNDFTKNHYFQTFEEMYKTS